MMSGVKGKALGAAAAAAVLGAGLAGLALAQDQTPSGAPPSWDALVRCAQMSDDDASLACFREAMRVAGYQPKPEAVAEEHRKRFGLSLPKLGVLKRKSEQQGAAQAGGGEVAAVAPPPPANENETTVTLDKVAILYDGKLLFITTDGAIWEQTDTTEIEPRPKPGETMRIHKGSLGSYFCDANAYKTIRCQRTR
jgi:hypothetical protein